NEDSGAAIDHTNIVQFRRLQVLNVLEEIQQLEGELQTKLTSTRPHLVEIYLCLDCSQLNNMLLRTVALILLCALMGMCATLGYYQTEANDEGEAATVVTQAAPLDSAFGDKISAADNQGSDLPEVEVQARETDTARDKHDEDHAAIEALAKKTVTQEQPPSEEETNEIRPVQTNKALNKPQAQEDASSWSLNSIRDSFQTVHGYFDSLVELVGGHNGVCQYRCRYGKDISCAFTSY
ncbi:hypothetical protein GOODEAATRI_003181, partial [Goodea atripinnis]